MSRQLAVGCLLVGEFETVDSDSIGDAIARLAAHLEKVLPKFVWKFRLQRVEDSWSADPVEPIHLCDLGMIQRDLREWDFVLTFSSTPLRGLRTDNVFSAASSACGVAMVSTADIDPMAEEIGALPDVREATLTARVSRLLAYEFAHLLGVQRDTNVEKPPVPVAEIDALPDATAYDWSTAEEFLHAIADQRLEEQPRTSRSALAFYLQSLWVNRREIAQSIIRAKPWQLPARLSRMSAAAASTLLVLIMTAEVWELGVRLDLKHSSVIALVTWVLTTGLLVVRQKLFIRRESSVAKEHKAIANVAAVAIITCGLLSVFCLLLGASLLMSYSLFSEELIARWTDINPVLGFHRAAHALLVASVGMVVGALGATLENRRYFRSALFIDDEL